jgi:hydroxymethylbilane synthase
MRLHPSITVEYRWIESDGDMHADARLSETGGKGLFTRAIEQTLIDAKADLAVHSMKDLPAGILTSGLVIAAVPTRADVRDCLITHGIARIEQLPPSASIGTSSPRRAAQLKKIRPDLRVLLMRGNVETRIKKVMADKQFDATVMSVAGLQRAGLSEYARYPIDTSVMLPAAGQGALAIQCKADDHVTLTRCLPLNDPMAGTAVNIERQIVAALGGGCHSSIAVFAEPVNRRPLVHMGVRARVLRPDGGQCIDVQEETPMKHLSRLVDRVVHRLLDGGAQAILSVKSEEPANASFA